MTRAIKPLGTGDTGGRKVMRPPHSLEVIRAIQKPAPTEPSETTTPSRRPDLDLSQYLVLPNHDHGSYRYPDLLVALRRTHMELAWEESQTALHKQGAFMLTIRQYADLLNMLRSGEVPQTGDGNTFRFNPRAPFYRRLFLAEEGISTTAGEWLNAQFGGERTGPNFAATRITSHDNDKWEPLLPYLAISGRIKFKDWLDQARRQGLPHPSCAPGGDIHYDSPTPGCVAAFAVINGDPKLHCDLRGDTRIPHYGVRAAYIK